MRRAFNIGDRVRITRSFSTVPLGATGVILRILEDDADFSIGVLFDNWRNGHDLGFLRGDQAHSGYWLFDDALDDENLQIIAPEEDEKLQAVEDLREFYLTRGGSYGDNGQRPVPGVGKHKPRRLGGRTYLHPVRQQSVRRDGNRTVQGIRL